MNNHKPLEGKQLVDIITENLQERLAEKITIINLQSVPGTSSDWFIVCQADNTSHTKAIAESVLKELKAKHTYPWHQEGVQDGRWVLIDYTDVVVHIMLPEIREYYDLENLWKEVEKTTIS
ncbi:ribosome silencing factor [Chitinispirillales bacterium ANBcel5]|uniref:ribosome silencing factor n=1 Tax=Cellulosispirillum alkaliphilum TaxID=3039283 RepID=UPI002A58B880|nr:ribosome silencing factor [Chitinispirillales bacterium ANBcel5]